MMVVRTGGLGRSVARLAIGVAGLAVLGAFPSPARAATFTKDIAPIIYTRCAQCHRPGGAAPFSLLTYADAKQKATQMAAATKARIMPPWKAEPGDVSFVGMTPLTAEQIASIQQWVKDGALEGDRRDLPPMPRWPEGWQLGAPDLVVKAEAYTLPASGSDTFRILVIPLPVERARYIRGFEFHPGNDRAVHHATIRIDPTPTSRRLADEDPGPGYSGLISRTAGYPDGHFLGWTPGQVPPLLPKGLAWRLDRGTDLVVELHMVPTGKPEVVQPTVGFFFTDDPPDRTPAMLRLGRQNIDITPGGRYTMTDSFVLPVDVEVQALQPHAHYRARDVESAARLPDGNMVRLITIKDWDFRWQHVYRLVKPLALPKGTVITARYLYDNSRDNPRNPDASVRVRWGQHSADEMGDLWVQVLTRNEAERQVLNAAFRPKMLEEDIVGYRARLERTPKDPSLHDDLALLYLERGQSASAVDEFRASLQLRPDAAVSYYNLGVALAAEGKVGEAAAAYRRALALKSDYSMAFNNLGALFLRVGSVDEAAAVFRRAIDSAPDNVSAHHNLATAHRLRGEWEAARSELEIAVRLEPDAPPLMTDLAMLLAASPIEALRDPGRAIAVAERAATLSGRRVAATLDVLGVAYASNARFEPAIESARIALALAPDDALAAAIRERIALYQQRRAYTLR